LKVLTDNKIMLSNQIKYYIIVRPTVDQRAGQLCQPHIGISKTEKIELKHKNQ